MAYKCVHCSKLYDDASNEILTGCSVCGRKFFFYIKKEKLAEIEHKKEEIEEELSPVEKKQIENDVRDIAGIKDDETPVFLDFESVKVIKSGKYLLDLPKLFATGKPQVYQLEDGKYIIDLTLITKTNEKTD